MFRERLNYEGTCDCGEEQLLKTEGFCSEHSGLLQKEDGIQDAQVKARMQLAFRKAFYYVVAAYECNPQRKFLLNMMNHLIRSLFTFGLNFSPFQFFTSELMASPVHFDGGLKRKKAAVPGHDDYSRMQPHSIDSDECNCSPLALILRYYSNVTEDIQVRYNKYLSSLACSDETKKKFVIEHYNHLAYILPSDKCFVEYPDLVGRLTGYLLMVNVDKEFPVRCNVQSYLTLMNKLTEAYALPLIPEHGGNTKFDGNFYCVQCAVEVNLKLHPYITASKQTAKDYMTKHEILSNMAPVLRTNFVPESDEMFSSLQDLWVSNFWSCGEFPIGMISEFIVEHHKHAKAEGLVTMMNALSEIIVSQDKLKMEDVVYSRWYLVNNFTQFVIGHLFFEQNQSYVSRLMQKWPSQHPRLQSEEV